MKKLLLLTVAMFVFMPAVLRAQIIPPTANQKGIVSANPPLYLLKTDSAQVPLAKTAFEKLNPEWLNSVEVFKGENATQRFGEKGKHGVILISLKKEHEREFLRIVQAQGPTEEAFDQGAAAVSIKLRCGSPLSSEAPLYIIKTKKEEFTLAQEAISTLNPNWISSINVLKGESAENKYKEKAKNGVIVISLKQENEQDALQLLKQQRQN
ncbi:hypothetical protein [Sabulibacter ruber]|uniref:hypothetical protein n=1 Tax=Sabulibacter ruber TaxID=2811901 RepID=UPI001A9675AC|nr:hypothetical protein [Sabulibacter ruber]